MFTNESIRMMFILLFIIICLPCILLSHLYADTPPDSVIVPINLTVNPWVSIYPEEDPAGTFHITTQMYDDFIHGSVQFFDVFETNIIVQTNHTVNVSITGMNFDLAIADFLSVKLKKVTQSGSTQGTTVQIVPPGASPNLGGGDVEVHIIGSFQWPGGTYDPQINLPPAGTFTGTVTVEASSVN